MTGLPFFEDFAPVGIRTAIACLESAEEAARTFAPFPGYDAMDGEEPGVTLSGSNPCRPAQREPTERHLRLVDLVDDVVTLVEEHPCGTLMRFRSGAAIVLSWKTTYDAAGLLVIEP